MPQETKYCHSSALATFPFQGSGTEVVDESGAANAWDGSQYRSAKVYGGARLCAYTWAEVQTKHDQLVAAGGGELHFVPNATYAVPLGGKVNIDSSYVSLKFNHAKIDISAYCPNVGTGFLGDFGVIFYIYSSPSLHDYSRHIVCRTIEDGHIVGNTDIYINPTLRTSITGNVGPRAFMFDTPTVGASNRMQFKRMRVVGAYKGLAYRSRSYFIRVTDNCEISRCGSGIYSECSAEDYTEKSTFDDYVIAENRIGINTNNSNIGFATFNIGTSTVNVPDHYIGDLTFNPRVKFSGGVLPTGLVADTLYYVLAAGLTSGSFQVSATVGGAPITFSGTSSGTTICNVTGSGQIFSFGNGSLDYNDQLMTLGNGSKVYFNKTSNWEFNYGTLAAETKAPITITGANTGVWGRGILGFRAPWGISTDPYYPSFVTMDNSSQVCDLEFNTARQLGEQSGAATTPDAFVTLLNSCNPKVRVLFEPEGVDPTDVPSMSSYSDTAGQIGQLRAGGDWIFGQLNALTTRTGTANATASDNTDVIATTSVGGSPATVTRKSGRPMMVFQNGTPTSAAKYYITFLTKEGAARNAWMFFFNTQAVTGNIVVKEMVATFAATFNGTTVTWAAAPDSPTYSNASGITLTPSSDWKRHGWKDHATTFYPSSRSNTSAAITIEIDMTAATGKLLLSHAGFDVLSLGR